MDFLKKKVSTEKSSISCGLKAESDLHVPNSYLMSRKQNRRALDRVKSISALSAHSTVKGLIGTWFLTLLTLSSF